MAPAITVSKSILPPTWTLPDEITTRLGETAGRQRPMEAAGHLLLVLHEPPGPDDTLRVGRYFWRDPGGSWKSNSLGTGVQALRKHVQEFLSRIEDLDERTQRAQQADDYFRVLQEIAPLLRTVRNLHETLQKAREILPAERDLITIRDLAGATERAAELLATDARNGLDFAMARASEEQSRRSYQMAVSAHRLNLMAAIFLPVATVSSIMGMELSHGLDRNDPGLFWLIAGIGVLAGALLTTVLGKKPAGPADRHAESRAAESRAAERPESVAKRRK